MNTKAIYSLILFGLCCAPLLASAQIPNWSWAKGSQNPGGTSHAAGMCITTDLFGNEYTTGYFESPTIAIDNDTIILGNHGFDDFYIMKLDAAGHSRWALSPGGANTTAECYSLKNDKWGNLYATGWFGNPSIIFGTDTLVNDTAGLGMFIAKYDSTGHEIWAKCAEGNGGGYSVAVDSAGNAYVSGTFTSAAINFGAFKLFNDTTGGYASIFIVKYDPAGNVLWAQTPHGIRGSEWCVTTDAAGDVYLAGAFTSSQIVFGAYTLNNDSSGGRTGDVCLVKYNSSGTVLWAKSAGGKKNDYINSIVADPAGDVYVAGYFTSDSITFGSTTLVNNSFGTNNSNMFLVKYEATGNILWANGSRLATTNATSVAIDAGGNPYVTCTTMSPLTVIGPDTLFTPCEFITRYDLAGTLQWIKEYSYHCQAASIALDLTGGIYVTGWFRDTVAFDTSVIEGTPGGAQDIYVVKLSEPISLHQSSVLTDAEGLVVYPVPNGGEMNVSLRGTGYSKLNVFGGQGRQILSEDIDANQNDAILKIKLNGAADGVYFLQVINKNGAITKRIVVSR